MEQERGGEDMDQNEDQRLKMMQEENQQQRPPNQKCPRCDSLNTKFCYYNNYSLSQPRYFCKTCRRYWTQGGTLRNIPAGGSCDKARHVKTSSSSSSSSSLYYYSSSGDQNSRSQPPHNLQGIAQSVVSNTNTPTLAAKELRSLDSPVAVAPNLMGPYYPATAAFHCLNNQSFSHRPPNNPVNQWFNLGCFPNMGLLHNFNPVTSYASRQRQQIQQQRQFHRVGSGDAMRDAYYPFYECEENLTHSGRPASSSHQQQINWHQVYTSNSASNPAVHVTTLWHASTTTTAANSISSSNTVNDNTSSSSLNPDQWDDPLAAYAPHQDTQLP